MAKLLVGPIIGEVTSTTARVLIEIDRAADVEIIASSRDGHVSQKASVRGRAPTAFQLSGLTPSTVYDLSVEGVKPEGHGRVRTFAHDQEGMNIGVVSCNFTVRRGDTDLWAVLRDKYVYQNDIDMVFHVGDQVYGDSAFADAVDMLRDRKRATKSQEREIIEAYRQLYRRTWNYRATADVLASVPNLMIWDDHEIRNSWGSLACDKDPTSIEHYVGTLARRVFREYQRQLWDPSATNQPSSGLENHFHVWGRIGAMFVDGRGGRSFQIDPLKPFLGTLQWDQMIEALGNGQFRNCTVLLVVTPVPLAYMGFGITEYGAEAVEDLYDHWALPAHRKEQLEFIRLLRRWKAEDENREVLVIGGDVHLGGYTDIKHDGEVIFRQMISSPITNRPPRWLQYVILRGLLEMNEELDWNYSFEHYDFTKDRNFGVVLVRAPSGEPAFVRPSVVTA
jgi:phosphodiesterase/alkaline phosphatase D-like protein